MSFNPEPVVYIANSMLTREVTQRGRRVVSSTMATLIGDMTIKWGRDTIWDQPPPATLTVTVIDPTGAWAQRVFDKTALGIPASVEWHTPYNFSHADAPGGKFRIFDGHTTDVKATRRRVATDAGDMWAWEVEITAADKLAVLGNVSVTNVQFPAATMVDRSIWLRDVIRNAAQVREVYFEDWLKTAPVSAVEYDTGTAADFAADMYTSMAQCYAYNPNRNVVTRIARHDGSHVQWTKDPTTGAIQVQAAGIVDTAGKESAHDTAPYASAPLSGATLSGEWSLSTDQSSEIDRVQMIWTNRHDGRKINSYTVRVGATKPIKLLELESWLSDGVQLDPVQQTLQVKAFGPEAGPHHPPVTFSTQHSGGFLNVKQAMVLTLPFETPQWHFLQGDGYIAHLTAYPGVAIGGGEIKYASGHWTITATLLAARNTVTYQGGPTWAKAAPEMTWAAADPTPHIGRGVLWFDAYWTPTDMVFYP